MAGEAPGSADVAAALSLAADLQREAHAREPRRVRRARARLGRLLADPAGRAAMLGLTDRVLRVPRPARAAALLAALPVEEARRFAGPVDALLLHAAVRSAPRLPWPTVPLVAERLRRETAP